MIIFRQKEKRETHQRDNGKWSLWQKQMMKIERRSREEKRRTCSSVRLQGRNKASGGHWRCFVLLPVQHWHQNAISSTRGQTHDNHTVSQSNDLSGESPQLPNLTWDLFLKLPEKKKHADGGTDCSSAGQSRCADCGVNGLEHNDAMGRDWQE